MFHSSRTLCAVILPALLAFSVLRAGEPVAPKVPEEKVNPITPEVKPEPKIPMPDFLKDDKQIASFGMGQFIGMQLSQLSTDLDVDAAIKSLLEGASGKPNNFDEKAMQEAMTGLQSFIQEKQAAAEKKPPVAPAPLANKDKVSYAVGQFFVQRLDLKTFAPDLDMALLEKGVNATAKGGKPQLDMQDANKSIQAYLGELEKKKGEKGIKEGEAFLAANKAKEGVKTTASGLQYKVLKEGTGPKPSSSAATVSVHYTGKLLDGTVFDSSVKRNQPAEFPLNGVIPGWTEGLQLMTEGSKYELYIPSAMAYGPSGRPGIPANAVLIFEVELLKIVKDAAPEPKKEVK